MSKIQEIPTKVSYAQYELLLEDYNNMLYMFSHDFSAPLRHVREFNRLLLNSLPSELNEDAEHYAKIVQESITKCEDMVSYILVLSRLSSHPLRFNPVNFVHVVNEVIAAIGKTHKNIAISMSVKEPPTLFGDRNQIHTLFARIFEHIIQRRKSDEHIDIQIDTVRGLDRWKFHIRPTVEGYTGTFSDDMFQLFNNVEINKENMNSNLCLPICKQIVMHHGGEIHFRALENGNSEIELSLNRFFDVRSG
jgi:light-regulated signal transduction histidine kinase (bacteriophytochrome)